MIKLSIDMAVIVNKELMSNGYREFGIKSNSDAYTNFNEYEIESIEKLCITNCYDLDELVLFPNLRSLHIKSADYNKLAPTIDYRESQVINHIYDFSVISKLSNLEELVIANDLYIKSLDISNLKNLRKLILINNPKLTKLIGLDNLENLNEITMYANNIDGTGFDFDKYINNTRLCVENTLDISMYLGIIDNDRRKAEYLEECEVKGEAFVRFAEKSGFLNCVCLSLRDLHELFLNLDVYFKKSNAYDLTDDEKIDFVCNYILNNTKFSKDLIVDRNIQYLADKEQYDDIPDRIRKRFNNFHSSYYAYRFKKANCEGRINLLVFMLKMLGMEAENVHCHDNRSDTIGSNHSIARVKVNSHYRYIDTSILESYKDIQGRKELLRMLSCNNMSEVTKLFLCADYDFMSQFVTFDAYEESLAQQERLNKEKRI